MDFIWLFLSKPNEFDGYSSPAVQWESLSLVAEGAEGPSCPVRGVCQHLIWCCWPFVCSLTKDPISVGHLLPQWQLCHKLDPGMSFLTVVQHISLSFEYKYHFSVSWNLNISVSLHRLNMSSCSSRLTPITRPVHCGTVIVIMSAAKLRSTQRKTEKRYYVSVVWSGDVMYSSGCFLMGCSLLICWR